MSYVRVRVRVRNLVVDRDRVRIRVGPAIPGIIMLAYFVIVLLIKVCIAQFRDTRTAMYGTWVSS